MPNTNQVPFSALFVVSPKDFFQEKEEEIMTFLKEKTDVIKVVKTPSVQLVHIGEVLSKLSVQKENELAQFVANQCDNIPQECMYIQLDFS